MKLRRADLDCQRRQILPGVRCDGPLHQPHVAWPDHRDRCEMPWLLAEPAQRGQAIGALVKRAEPALGSKRAPNTLDDDLQPALGKQAPEQQAEQLPASVGGAHQHRRLRPLTGVARHPTIGQQHRPIVHRDAQVALAHDIARLRARQTHAPGKDATRQAHGREPSTQAARLALRAQDDRRDQDVLTDTLPGSAHITQRMPRVDVHVVARGPGAGCTREPADALTIIRSRPLGSAASRSVPRVGRSWARSKEPARW